MSAIDWETKPEPWRSIGLKFVKSLPAILAGERPEAGGSSDVSVYRHWSASDRRRVLNMRAQGKKYREIAEEFGVTNGAIVSLIRRRG